MRFNLEIETGDYKTADAAIFGRLVNVSLWMGKPSDAVESRYKVEFANTWPPELDVMKAHDAIRISMAHALENGFDPFLITLIEEEKSMRWQGRIIGLAGPQ